MEQLPTITIRQETKEDKISVFEINKLAFEQENEALLVDRLRSSPAFVPELSLVAFAGNQPVGHILFTKIQIIGPGSKKDRVLALAPLAVLPNFQKRGIGGALIREGIKIATDIGNEAIIVLGHEHYYPKFGFVAAEKWGIKAPFDVSSSNFMALELVTDALSNVSGVVEYSPEFGIVSSNNSQ